MTTPPPPSSFVSKLNSFLPLVEMIAAAMLGLAIILKYMNIDAEQLIIVSLSTLAGVFYLSSFKRVDVERKEGEILGFKDLLAQTILPKVLGISCAVGVIAILFYMINSKGYAQMAMIGGSSTALALIVMSGLYATGTKNLESQFPIVLRAVPIMILNIYIFMQYSE